jgi:hypothetical protein
VLDAERRALQRELAADPGDFETARALDRENQRRGVVTRCYALSAYAHNTGWDGFLDNRACPEALSG